MASPPTRFYYSHSVPVYRTSRNSQEFLKSIVTQISQTQLQLSLSYLCQTDLKNTTIDQNQSSDYAQYFEPEPTAMVSFYISIDENRASFRSTVLFSEYKAAHKTQKSCN